MATLSKLIQALLALEKEDPDKRKVIFETAELHDGEPLLFNIKKIAEVDGKVHLYGEELE